MSRGTLQALAAMPASMSKKGSFGERQPRGETCGTSNRARSLKAQFVEVYIGSQVFKELNLKTAVSINLLASERMYEIVVVNQESVKEIQRLYVHEDELLHQMRTRRAAILAARDAYELEQAEKSTIRERSRRSRRGHRESIPPNCLVKLHLSHSSDSTEDLTTSRQTSNEMQEKERRQSFDEKISSRKASIRTTRRGTLKNGLIQSQDSSLYYTQPPTLLKDMEVFRLISHNNRCSSSTARLPKVRNPKTYFNLVAGSDIIPDVASQRKWPIQNILANIALLSSDISAVPMHDINYCTSVILQSFFVRETANEEARLQFLLFDDGSDSFFFSSGELPGDCAQFASCSVVDAASLVQRVCSTRHWKMSLDSDTKELETVQTLLKSADGYCRLSASDLHVVHKTEHEENINPNKHPYRYMLQTAIGSVVGEVRRRKNQRSAWYRVIETKKAINMREAFLAEQAVSSKSFRTLAHRSANHDASVNSTDIASYRASLSSRSKKRPSSRHAHIIPEAAAAAKSAAESKTKRQRQSLAIAYEDDVDDEEEI